MATISAWSADGRREVVVPGPLRRGQIVNAPIEEDVGSAKVPPQVKRILLLACEVWGIELHHLLSDRRSVQFTEPRFAAILLASEKTGFTLHRLGIAFGRDHTTIMHAISRAKQMLAEGQEPFTSQYKVFSSLYDGRSPQPVAKKEFKEYAKVRPDEFSLIDGAETWKEAMRGRKFEDVK